MSGQANETNSCTVELPLEDTNACQEDRRHGNMFSSTTDQVIGGDISSDNRREASDAPGEEDEIEALRIDALRTADDGGNDPADRSVEHKMEPEWHLIRIAYVCLKGFISCLIFELFVLGYTCMFHVVLPSDAFLTSHIVVRVADAISVSACVLTDGKTKRYFREFFSAATKKQKQVYIAAVLFYSGFICVACFFTSPIAFVAVTVVISSLVSVAILKKPSIKRYACSRAVECILLISVAVSVCFSFLMPQAFSTGVGLSGVFFMFANFLFYVVFLVAFIIVSAKQIFLYIVTKFRVEGNRNAKEEKWGYVCLASLLIVVVFIIVCYINNYFPYFIFSATFSAVVFPAAAVCRKEQLAAVFRRRGPECRKTTPKQYLSVVDRILVEGRLERFVSKTNAMGVVEKTQELPTDPDEAPQCVNIQGDGNNVVFVPPGYQGNLTVNFS